MKHPIDNIQWLSPSDLHANGYNPNVVLNQELKLLKFSILKQGWLQPILATADGEVIDGYHRWWLASTDAEVQKLTDGKVPVAVLDVSEPERMLLTIRINRAKGSHVSLKMHDIVSSLHNDHGYSVEQIMEGIGAPKDEVQLLLAENVFVAKNTKDHTYSKAWKPVAKVQ